MTIGERIRKVRRTLDLTQQEFCSRIGLKRNSISLIESGGRNTSDQTIYSICREFNVREEWLRTGKGEMFAPAPSAALDALAKERGLSRGAYIAIEKFLNLKPDIQAEIIDYFINVAAALTAEPPEVTRSKSDAQLLREEADAVERGQGKSSASPLEEDA